MGIGPQLLYQQNSCKSLIQLKDLLLTTMICSMAVDDLPVIVIALSACHNIMIMGPIPILCVPFPHLQLYYILCGP